MKRPSPPRRILARRILKWLFCAVLISAILLLMVLAFFTWSAGQREVESPGSAAPTTGHFVKAADAEVFIQEAGPSSGQAVLLIHGMGAWSEIWRETMTPLAEAGFHVIAIDIPPFGYSEKLAGVAQYSRENQAKRILGVLDALNIESAILVGHSVGARPTLEAALGNPGRVDKLVLVAPALGFQVDPEDTPHFEQNDPSWLVETLFSIKPLRNALQASSGTNPWLTKNLFTSFVSKTESVTDFRIEMLQKPLVVQDLTSATADWIEYLTTAQDESLGSDFNNFKTLPMPVFIIWGTADTITPLWQSEALKSLIPGSELSVMEGIGHMPYIEDVEEFNELLLEFLRPTELD